MPKEKPVPSPAVDTARRSPCPVACLLDMIGDRWTLLVIRDLMLGRSRFKDFSSSPEGIPTNILSERLDRLVRHGLSERMPAEDGGKRLAYRLTEKGWSLRPVLEAMRDWGLAWEPGTRAMMVPRSNERASPGKPADRKPPPRRNSAG